MFRVVHVPHSSREITEVTPKIALTPKPDNPAPGGLLNLRRNIAWNFDFFLRQSQGQGFVE
jgi:hypothetical protein